MLGRDPSGTRSNIVFEQYRLAGLFTEVFATWARHLQEQKTLIILQYISRLIAR